VAQARSTPAKGTNASEILNVTFDDSADGTQRNYDVTCGAAVDTLFVHHRLWPVGSGRRSVRLHRRSWAIDHRAARRRRWPLPLHARASRPRPAAVQHSRAARRRRHCSAGDEVFKIILDPAPPAMSAKMHASVTNGTADISVDVTAGVSDWPVSVLIYEGSPNTTPLVNTTITRQPRSTKSTFPVLGGRRCRCASSCRGGRR
jgi:hypothetical protein